LEDLKLFWGGDPLPPKKIKKSATNFDEEKLPIAANIILQLHIRLHTKISLEFCKICDNFPFHRKLYNFAEPSPYHINIDS